ncbi:ABC transporter [Paenibacillus oryzae]|uniref:ABC transporter n=1 Tax=Paenibacillus oryzae TaxID=1844972 RepID=A0A1A5YQG6_9BACL|nr:AarF/ABC1/UbiB kinase family protein [Paenibacillus oryzae]OBR67645.1 ABC transporter [Paenibacillus oryzae]
MLANKFRHLIRYRTIVGALTRNGFGYVADGLNNKGKSWRAKDGEMDHPSVDLLGKRIRLMLEELGPTFVKLGQIASTRPDLFPGGVIEELKRLQDHVKPFSYSEVVNIVESELKSPVSTLFKSFSEEPLASASIGQVHRAVLKSGDQVIVKIQRPDIHKTIGVDLEILTEWARISEMKMSWAKHYHLRDAVEELSNALLDELDYMKEARNAEKLKARNTLAYIHIPDVYWEFTTRRVLTMEFVKGIPFSEPARLREAQLDTKQLANRFATSIFSQILELGFFHADPHPGNVMALPDGRVAFLDFGMVGRLPEHLKNHFASFVIALRNQSTRGVIRAISRMGVVPDDIDQSKLFDDVDELRQKYYQVPLNQVSVGVAVQDLFQVAYRHRIRIPNEMTMLGKAMLTMEGVATSLDPEISVVDVAEPFGAKLFLNRLNPIRMGKQVMEEVPELVDAVQELPGSVKRLMKLVRQGKLRIEADSPQLGELLNKLDRLFNRLAFSIVLLALSIVMLGLIIGAAISGTVSPIMGKIPVIEVGFAIAFLMFLWLIYAIFRSGRF